MLNHIRVKFTYFATGEPDQVRLAYNGGGILRRAGLENCFRSTSGAAEQSVQKVHQPVQGRVGRTAPVPD